MRYDLRAFPVILAPPFKSKLFSTWWHYKLLLKVYFQAFTEDEIKQLCKKAANGNIHNDVKKTKNMIRSFHLMMDKEEREKCLGYAFATFYSHEMALKCLR